MNYRYQGIQHTLFLFTLISLSACNIVSEETTTEPTTDQEPMAGMMTIDPPLMPMNAGTPATDMMTGGEVQTAPMPAGTEMMGGETSMVDDPMESGMNADASPTVSSLSEAEQRAYCEDSIQRNQDAEDALSENDRMQFQEKTCLIAGLVELTEGGGRNDCETARDECLNQLNALDITVDNCLENTDLFTSCEAPLDEFQQCEDAMRSLIIQTVLDADLSLYSCATPALLLLGLSELIPETPDECTPAAQTCLD